MIPLSGEAKKKLGMEEVSSDWIESVPGINGYIFGKKYPVRLIRTISIIFHRTDNELEVRVDCLGTSESIDLKIRIDHHESSGHLGPFMRVIKGLDETLDNGTFRRIVQVINSHRKDGEPLIPSSRGFETPKPCVMVQCMVYLASREHGVTETAAPANNSNNNEPKLMLNALRYGKPLGNSEQEKTTPSVLPALNRK